jgi:hypothetical protein
MLQRARSALETLLPTRTSPEPDVRYVLLKSSGELTDGPSPINEGLFDFIYA